MELPYISTVAHPDSYSLELNDDQSGYLFTTKDGVRYHVAFIEDHTLNGYDIYQLVIMVVDGSISKRDGRIEKTVGLILETFFEYNQNGLLYICDNSDGRQAARNRLFRSWFYRSQNHFQYTLCNQTMEVNDDQYFIGLILRNDNAQREELVNSFMEFCQELNAKWDDYDSNRELRE